MKGICRLPFYELLILKTFTGLALTLFFFTLGWKLFCQVKPRNFTTFAGKYCEQWRICSISKTKCWYRLKLIDFLKKLTICLVSCENIWINSVYKLLNDFGLRSCAKTRQQLYAYKLDKRMKHFQWLFKILSFCFL